MRALVRRTAVAGAAALVLGAVTTVAGAQEDGPARDRYRLAKAQPGDVEQTLTLTGTVEHEARSDVGFATSGTVAEVYVEQGDRVEPGQRLAVLDRAELQAAVTAAKAALAQAKAQLEVDQNRQREIVEDAAGPKAPDRPQQQEQPQQPQQPHEPEPSEPDPAVAEALAEIAAQQKAVREAQTASTRAIADATAALAAQRQACEVTDEQPTPSEDCTASLVAVQAAQDRVAAAQDTLQQALAALTDTVSKALAAVTGQAADRPTAAGASGSVVTPALAMEETAEEDVAGDSAASIAADQAAIDQAEAELLTARRALAAAVLRAPRAGRVAALALEPGDGVTDGSAVLTVVGKGRTTVAASTTVDKLGTLKTGQRATVTVPGRDQPLAGRVTSVGLLPVTGEEATTYPVVVTLDGGGAVPTGSTASIAVVVRTARDVVTVPASAVSDGTVRALENGRPVTRRVTVGAVGARLIEVAGIDPGTLVVLADRQAALPSAQEGRLGGAILEIGPREGPGGPSGQAVLRLPG